MATQSESIRAALTEIGSDVAALKKLVQRLVEAHASQTSYDHAVITAMATGSAAAASAATASDEASEAAAEEVVQNKYFQTE